MNDQEGLAIAIEEAKTSYKEGGVPVRSPTLLLSSLHAMNVCITPCHYDNQSGDAV